MKLGYSNKFSPINLKIKKEMGKKEKKEKFIYCSLNTFST
jgi:hypothetical protein